MRNLIRFSCVLASTAVLIAAVVLALGAASQHAQAATTFTVNSTGDESDAGLNGVCSTAGGMCTLRAAVQEANYTAGQDTIGFGVTGAITIVYPLTNPLPILRDLNDQNTHRPGCGLNGNKNTGQRGGHALTIQAGKQGIVS